MIVLAVLLFRGCEKARDEQRERVIAAAEEMLRAQTPDMIPPLAAKPIDEAALKKAAAVPLEKFCRRLGTTLRGHDQEFTRAMIKQAADQGLGILKFRDHEAIKKKHIHLGMTSCMAAASWGYPERVNRSVGSYGVHEQWIYSANYVYFEDGVLTSWQD